jgi:hypothetical protein
MPKKAIYSYVASRSAWSAFQQYICTRKDQKVTKIYSYRDNCASCSSEGVEHAGVHVCCQCSSWCQFEHRTKAAETLSGLSAGYGYKALKISAVYDRHNRSKKGQESLEDEERTGRPATSRNDRYVATFIQSWDLIGVSRQQTNWHFIWIGSEHSERGYVSATRVCKICVTHSDGGPDGEHKADCCWTIWATDVQLLALLETPDGSHRTSFYVRGWNSTEGDSRSKSHTRWQLPEVLQQRRTAGASVYVQNANTSRATMSDF